MENGESKQFQINRPKIFSVLSLISAIAAGNYFIGEQLLEAVAFTAMASIFDSAGIGAETNKQKNWRAPIKNALDRTGDAAIFIGFMISGIASETLGAFALVLAIMLPYWVKKIWKINIRRFFHAALIAWCVYFLSYRL